LGIESKSSTISTVKSAQIKDRLSVTGPHMKRRSSKQVWEKSNVKTQSVGGGTLSGTKKGRHAGNWDTEEVSEVWQTEATGGEGTQQRKNKGNSPTALKSPVDSSPSGSAGANLRRRALLGETEFLRYTGNKKR